MAKLRSRCLGAAAVAIMALAGCEGSTSADDADGQTQDQPEAEPDAPDSHGDDAADTESGESLDVPPDLVADGDSPDDVPGEHVAEDGAGEDGTSDCLELQGEVQSPVLWILETGIGVHATFGLTVTNPNPAGSSCAVSAITIDEVAANGGSSGAEITILSEVTASGAPLAVSLSPGASSSANYEAVDPYMSPVTFCGSPGFVGVVVDYVGDGGTPGSVSLSSASVTISCL